MMGKAGLYLWLGLLVLLNNGGQASAADGHSNCETTGTVLEDLSATITCHFYRHHDKFMIYRLEALGEEEIVTTCTHTKNGPDCNLLDGNTITTTPARDRAVLTIASAQQKNSGKYFCKTFPEWEDNANNCTLVVQSNTLRDKGLVTCKTNVPVPHGQKCLLTCEFAKTVGSTGIKLVKELDHEGSSEEEILLCDKAGNCTLKKDGYEMAEKTTTRVAVSIPHLKTDYTGKYKCESATLKGISHGCHLDLQVASDTTSDDAGVSTYIIVVTSIGALVAVLVAIVLGGVLYVVRRRRMAIHGRGAYAEAPNG